MSRCERCGFVLPEGAVFCPNCGAPIKQKTAVLVSTRDDVTSFLNKGLLGAFLSVTMWYFSPNVDLFFLPSFMASLIVTYLSRVKRFKDATLIALTIYLFADAIEAGIVLGSVYASNEPLASLYGDYVPTLFDVLMYTVSPLTALVAGYIGARLAPGKEEEALPISYNRKEESGPGGVVYSIKEASEKKWFLASEGLNIVQLGLLYQLIG